MVVALPTDGRRGVCERTPSALPQQLPHAQGECDLERPRRIYSLLTDDVGSLSRARGPACSGLPACLLAQKTSMPAVYVLYAPGGEPDQDEGGPADGAHAGTDGRERHVSGVTGD